MQKQNATTFGRWVLTQNTFDVEAKGLGGPQDGFTHS
jgi:hypothetical protein